MEIAVYHFVNQYVPWMFVDLWVFETLKQSASGIYWAWEKIVQFQMVIPLAMYLWGSASVVDFGKTYRGRRAYRLVWALWAFSGTFLYVASSFTFSAFAGLLVFLAVLAVQSYVRRDYPVAVQSRDGHVHVCSKCGCAITTAEPGGFLGYPDGVTGCPCGKWSILLSTEEVRERTGISGALGIETPREVESLSGYSFEAYWKDLSSSDSKSKDSGKSGRNSVSRLFAADASQ